MPDCKFKSATTPLIECAGPEDIEPESEVPDPAPAPMDSGIAPEEAAPEVAEPITPRPPALPAITGLAPGPDSNGIAPEGAENDYVPLGPEFDALPAAADLAPGAVEVAPEEAAPKFNVPFSPAAPKSPFTRQP